MIDLHVHSNCSDGTLSPEEVVNLAVKTGLDAFALTDHDTISGVPIAIRQASLNEQKGNSIMVIPGIEISARYKKREIHILGLFIDYQNQKLNKTLEELIKERESRNEKMVFRFQNAGIPLTIEDLNMQSGNPVITRAHFAKQLIKMNYVSSTKEAFQKYLNEDSPFYVNRNFISPEGAIDLIKEAKGIPVLAHPVLYHLPDSELDSLVKRLAEYGMQGIEAIYSTYNKKEENSIKSLASKYNLIITGGSDFHGGNKPDISLGIGMGNLHIPNSILNNILSLT